MFLEREMEAEHGTFLSCSLFTLVLKVVETMLDGQHGT